jgi:nitrite reductase/ring-hydroxylating ferredoxin subunit
VPFDRLFGKVGQVPRSTHVCAVDELPPGEMKLLPLGKFGVGVYNVHGEFHAITNYCQHQGAPLCLGYTTGINVYDPTVVPGRIRHIREGEILRCPWHRWEFDLKTGKVISDPRRGIRIYETEVRDGQVYVLT